MSRSIEKRMSFYAVRIICGLFLSFAGAASAFAQQGSAAPPSNTSTAKTGSSAAPSAQKSTGSTTAKNPTTTGSGATKTTGTKATTTAAPSLTTDKQKNGYALGILVGRNFAQQQVDPGMIDPNTFVQGFKDSLAGTKPALSDDELKTAIDQLQKVANDKQQAANEKQQAAVAALGEANLKEGQEFLANNKTKEGVVTLPSGLQYKVITMGTGPKPSATDTVVCDYRGTLINGKEFDSSYQRKQTATFPLNGVIKGWTEALQLMPTGSKWQLFLPPDLAYGNRGAGPDIGPNSTLIFEVELHSIKGK